VPYVVGLCTKGTPQASQAGSCSMPRRISGADKQALAVAVNHDITKQDKRETGRGSKLAEYGERVESQAHQK
jgi:hypothetical protein